MQNRANIKNSAKSLTEVLIYMLIVATVYLSNDWQSCFFRYKENKNLIQLKKLQQALYLAKLEAINHNHQVSIYPVNNNYWNNNLVIIMENKKILHHILINFTEINQAKLKFQFFGNQKKQIITFLPNGLTYNNGNFCINSKAICLYINKAGKIYINN